MGLGDLAAILAIWCVAAMSPGPDVVMVLRQTMRGGRRAGVVSALGVSFGILLWTTLAMAGAHVLVESDHRILGTLQLVGGLYLVYLSWQGVRALRAGDPNADAAGAIADESTGANHDPTASNDDPGRTGARPTEPSLRRSFGLGLLTNLSNPKALVFFGSVFTVLVPAGTSSLDRGLLGVLLVAIAAAWFSALAWTTSTDRVARTLQRRARTIDTIAAVAFGALGLAAAGEGARALTR